MFPCDYFQASKDKQVTMLHHWLLLPVSTDSAVSALSDDSLITALEPLHLPLDSDVTVAHPVHDHVLVQEVYRVVTGQSLTVTSPRDWSPAEGFPLSPRRDNYGGIVLPSATVVIYRTFTSKIRTGCLVWFVRNIASSRTSRVRLFAVCMFLSVGQRWSSI